MKVTLPAETYLPQKTRRPRRALPTTGGPARPAFRPAATIRRLGGRCAPGDRQGGFLPLGNPPLQVADDLAEERIAGSVKEFLAVVLQSHTFF